MGKKVVLNTGWRNWHGELASKTYQGVEYADSMEQRVAWAAQLDAIGDARSNYEVWCAGQDFERYCKDKFSQPDSISTSWRNAPAQEIIINRINKLVNASSN